jgi:hypothetical protein
MENSTDTRRSEYLDVGGVVALLPGTTRTALYVQRHRGQNPGALAVKVGKRLVWRRADIERWWEAEQAAAAAGR